MSLSDLASIGSFVSGIAVIITLVLLLLQTRQTVRNQRSLMQQGRTARVIDTIFRFSEPTLMEARTGGVAGDPDLEPLQIEIFLNTSYATFLNFEDTFLQYRMGTIDPAAWATSTARLKRLLASPGMRVAWKSHRSVFEQSYVDLVDEVIAGTTIAAPVDRVSKWKADLAAEVAV